MMATRHTMAMTIATKKATAMVMAMAMRNTTMTTTIRIRDVCGDSTTVVVALGIIR